jgi:hypothetical protein
MLLARVLTIASLTVTVALAGCGGDDGGGGGGGGGDTHPVGHEAVIEHADINSEGNPKTKLAITVEAVRKGTQAELEAAGFKLDGDEKSATPYYVDVSFENQGPSDISNGLSVSMTDDKGGSISSTTIIDLGGEPFKQCPQVKSGTLKTGSTLEACDLFLVPEGRTPDKLSFLPYDPKSETEFVYWDAS